MKVGIACASGSVKGVFVHGVLSAFERRGFRANVYAASSSSAIPAAFASIGALSFLNGAGYWKKTGETYRNANSDVSKAVKAGIREVLPALLDRLFVESEPSFAVAASLVVTDEAARITQGDEARKMGKQLVLSVRKRDRTWANNNLSCTLFSTRTNDAESRLTPENLGDALYATTRMLHAWNDPAWINGRPYVDASYTCMCPAVELTEMDTDVVIAISPENGTLYRDFFESELLPSSFGGTRIHHIQPPVDLSEIGVDYLKATPEALSAAFSLGEDAGSRFLDSLKA